MTAYEVSRSAVLPCDLERAHGLLDDFREWPAWSPWEGLDPHMSRTYSGPDSGVGARYEWSGNKRAGEGTMEVTVSTPEHIEVALQFLKPFKSRSAVIFDLTPVDDGTRLSWIQTGTVSGLVALMAKVYPMEKALGPDMEKGLANLVAQTARPAS
ncbi:polyketide cyclase/dehydrase/lipid transport protein [Nocardioides albertanoniae]|uniref:Polyketide cyclase/dehydrase/lipid transport protein n=1 Tax=Nocardioides albertanoniae TaxID=1175486 RepID=A0A543A9H2_9ACTN|nr:SRPBCC family protein [Nocardioides albertanoniae]TQL69199.1 polyketide cyclase/dehydrase/lipid transport protein [Nocardioides albertanoniae]